MSDFCEDHEYAYAGDECPFCQQSIGFGATDVEEDHVRDAVQSAAESAFGVDRREQVWTEDSGFYRFTEDLTDHLRANLDAAGRCQRPDRDTFVELVTDPELARIEQEFAESMERLERLNTLVALTEALEDDYEDDFRLTERQIVREIRLKAEQLRRGAVSDN